MCIGCSGISQQSIIQFSKVLQYCDGDCIRFHSQLNTSNCHRSGKNCRRIGEHSIVGS